jgi:hypothetical protein
MTASRLILLTTVVASSPAAAQSFQPVSCEGTYKYHLQGVCTDEKDSIFWSFTTELVKTDRAGRIVKKVEVANHHGDLCFHAGKVYVAVNLGEFNNPQGHADSWVYVYDAGDLACVGRHETPEVFHGAGGMAVDGGRFLVVGGLPDDVNENYVYEYNGEFTFVKKHALASGHTHLGIQTATFGDGFFWFGCYGRAKSAAATPIPPMLLKVDASLTKIERFEFDCSLGIVPAGDGRFLVARGGINKDKRQTGRLLLAAPGRERGLTLVEGR